MLEKQAIDFDKESRKEGVNTGNVSLEAGLSYKKIRVASTKKATSPKSPKKEPEDALLIVNIRRGSKLKLSPDFDGDGKIAPKFEQRSHFSDFSLRRISRRLP